MIMCTTVELAQVKFKLKCQVLLKLLWIKILISVTLTFVISSVRAIAFKGDKLNQILWAYAFLYLPQRLARPMNWPFYQWLLSIISLEGAPSRLIIVFRVYSATPDIKANSWVMLGDGQLIPWMADLWRANLVQSVGREIKNKKKFCWP